MTSLRDIPLGILQVLPAFGFNIRTQPPGVIRYEERTTTADIERCLLGGRASAITARDVRFYKPDHIIIEDGATDEQISRISSFASGALIWSESRFLGVLWGSERINEWAHHDALAGEDSQLPAALQRPETEQPRRSYAEQHLQIGEERRNAELALDQHLKNPMEELLVVIGRAGMGKSELCKVVEWKAATKHRNALLYQKTATLPPVVLRVPLQAAQGLALQDIADYFSLIRLHQLTDLTLLRYILATNRLVLLLDGLDELRSPAREVTDAFGELRELVTAGASITITSRPGYFGADQPSLREQFVGKANVATLLPLAGRERQVAFLEGYGASRSAAEDAMKVLKPDQREVPLFLLWAYRSRTTDVPGCGDDAIDESVGASEVLTLLELIRCFCARDERRLGMRADQQIDVLTDVAWEVAQRGPIAMEEMSYLVGELGSPFVEAPHALLERTTSGAITFGETNFLSLFLARAIQRRWREEARRGDAALDSWLRNHLGGRFLDKHVAASLDSLTIDYLAHLVSQGELAHAWAMATRAPARYVPRLRRNLFAVAYAKVVMVTEAANPRARGERLAWALEKRDLADCALNNILVEYVDFAGWDLRSCVAPGAKIQYCDLRAATVDKKTFDGADLYEVEGLAHGEDDMDLARAVERLTSSLRPWRNLARPPPALLRRVGRNEPGIDEKLMRQLRREGMCSLERGERGQQFWRLSDHGRTTLEKFLSQESAPQALLPVLRRLS